MFMSRSMQRLGYWIKRSGFQILLSPAPPSLASSIYVFTSLNVAYNSFGIKYYIYNAQEQVEFPTPNEEMQHIKDWKCIKKSIFNIFHRKIQILKCTQHHFYRAQPKHRCFFPSSGPVPLNEPPPPCRRHISGALSSWHTSSPGDLAARLPTWLWACSISECDWNVVWLKRCVPDLWKGLHAAKKHLCYLNQKGTLHLQ